MNGEKEVMFAPSILSADFAMLMQEIRKVKGAEYLHIDVMDGHFVPEVTIGPGVLSAIHKHLEIEDSQQRLDVHLMIERPELQIEKFVMAGGDIITIHAEATPHLHRLITRIKAFDIMAGVALNPSTPLSAVEEVIEELDLLLIMSVNPGYGGQSFIPSSLLKIERASHMLEDRNPNALLEVDGGVNLTNARLIVNAGAEILVAGSAIFNEDPGKSLDELRRTANGT